MRRTRAAARYARMGEFRLRWHLKEIVPDHNENWKLEGAYLRLQGCTQLLICIYAALVVVFLLLSASLYLHQEGPGAIGFIEYVHAGETVKEAEKAEGDMDRTAEKQPWIDRVRITKQAQGQYAFTLLVLAIASLVMPYPLLYKARERYKQKNAKEWIAMERWIAHGMEGQFLVSEWLTEEGEKV